MKKFFFLLLLFLIVVPKSTVLADEGTPSAMVSPTAPNTYTLPYPGILPDNPLYIFKVMRDGIVTFFIADPSKKSAFFLLQSDKRLASSWYLVKEGSAKDALALTTLSKSTNYLSQSIDQLHAAQESGDNMNAQIDSIVNATAKHISVVTAILQLQGLTNKDAFATELKRLQDLQKVVSKISSS